MLSEAQQAAYQHDGYLLVPGAVSEAACARMCDRLWEVMARTHGIRREHPDTWTTERPSGLQAATRSNAFADVASPTLLAAVDGLIGTGTWDPPEHWAQPLVLFPCSGAWTVPARMWHLDYPVRGGFGSRFAVKLLCLLAPLEPRGGGTLLLEGSHRLITQLAESGTSGSSSSIRKRLARRYPWFRDLFSRQDRSDRTRRFMIEGTTIDGIDLRVVEMTGAAGDAVLFHPWLLHNASPNRGETPRMMVGQNLPTRRGLDIYRPAAAAVPG